MAKAKFERAKPHVNISIIGHVDHGRTTTTAAITEVLVGKFPDLSESSVYGTIDKTPEEEERGIAINISRVEYQTEKCHYVHVDAPGHADYIRNMVTGAAQMDGVILVIAATDGPVPRTREYALLTRQVDVPCILVALNECDMVSDEKVIELVEVEVRGLLAEQGYDEEAPTVHISAPKTLEGEEEWVNSILELMEACDESTPNLVREIDKPLPMPIGSISTITGRGTIVTGCVERGVLSVNDGVEILGIKEKFQKTTVAGIEMFRKLLDSAKTGDSCGLPLHGIKHEDIERGQIVAKPGVYTPHTGSEGSVYTLSEDEGGRHIPFFNNYCPQFYLHTTDVTDVVSPSEGVGMIILDDSISMSVKLIQSVAMDEGLRFTIRESGRTVNAGRVTKVIK